MTTTTLEEALDIVNKSGRYKTLEIYKYKDTYNSIEGVDPSKIALGVSIDTEATSTDPKTGEIINLGAIQFSYNLETFDIYGITATYNGFNQPMDPIPHMITQITGITNEAVQGQKLDLDMIEDILKPARLIVAHNAEFDRKFVDRLSPASRALPWVCSYKAIPWLDYGIVNRSQVGIAQTLGFMYNSHKAAPDALALLHILANPFNNNAFMRHVDEDLSIRRFLIRTYGSPYITKDLLKAREYRWNADDDIKVWEKVLPAHLVVAEKEWLDSHIYGSSNSDSLSIREIERVDLHK